MDIRGIDALFIMYGFTIIQDMKITYRMEK